MKAELFFSQFHIPAVCVQLCFMLMLNSKQKLSQLSIMCAWVHTYSIWEWEYTVYMWNWRFVGGKKYSDEEMNDIIIQTITLTLPLNLPRDCVRDTIKEENFIGKCVHLSTGCVFDQGLQRPVFLFGVTTRPNVTWRWIGDSEAGEVGWRHSILFSWQVSVLFIFKSACNSCIVQ